LIDGKKFILAAARRAELITLVVARNTALRAAAKKLI